MRRRVLLLVAATTSLVLVAFLVPLALLVRTVAAERAVLAATADAQALTALVAVADPASLAVAVAQVDATSPAQVSVFTADGPVLGAPAPRTPLVELAARGSSASGIVDGGGREIVFAVRDPAGRTGVIRTFVTDAALTAGVGRAWLLLAGLGVVLLGVSLLVADRLARRLVRATIDVAAVSHRLARGELDARADPDAPVEVGVVAGALNTLAGRISELLREERETVADLSHRVRTPLTALRLDAEALPRAEDAARIGAGVDAVQRAVTSVIDAARRRATDAAGCDAAEMVADRVAFWSVLAEDTDRDVAPTSPPARCRSRWAGPTSRRWSTRCSATCSRTPRTAPPSPCASAPGRAEGPGWWSPTPGPGCASEPTSCAGARAAAGPPAWASTSPAAPPSRPAADSRSAARRGAGWR